MRRSASSISASGSLTTKGGVRASESTVISLARSSTWPVASRAFSEPAVRGAMVPRTRRTYSLRTLLATSWASGDSAASMTTCVMP